MVIKGPRMLLCINRFSLNVNGCCFTVFHNEPESESSKTNKNMNNVIQEEWKFVEFSQILKVILDNEKKNTQPCYMLQLLIFGNKITFLPGKTVPLCY